MRRICVLAAALSLLVAGPALARVPKFKPKTIVPGKSIGGVKVGMTKKKAVRAWGRKPDRCQPEAGTTWCQYLAVSSIGSVHIKQPFAGFWLLSGKVVQLEVEFAENTAVDPKVRRLKTSKDIKLGSTMAAARSAYGIGPPSGGEAGLSRALFKKAGRCTLFYAPEPPYTRIDAIWLGRCSTPTQIFGR